MDDVMSSHKNKKVNDIFYKWLNKMCGSYGDVKAACNQYMNIWENNLIFFEKVK